MRYSDAYGYCEDKGMGLAMWHNAELYEDIKYLAHKTTVHGLLTALSNKYDEQCASKDDCHGKLIWQQETNGAEEYFETHTAYNSITAKNSLPIGSRFKFFGRIQTLRDLHLTKMLERQFVEVNEITILWC